MKGSLEIERYGVRTRPYSPSPSPSSLMSSIFTTTVNMAAKTLVSAASPSKSPFASTDSWRLSDHLRFMARLMAWVTLWFLRVLTDHFPSLGGRLQYSLQSARLASTVPGSFDFPPLLTYPVAAAATSASALALPSSSSSLEMILHEDADGPSIRALGRALSHILGLLNDIPASSRKYQFAMSMADRILEENARDGHEDLLEINRMALASAFSRTSSLLYSCLQQTQSKGNASGMFPTSIIRALPMGSYINSYLKGVNVCVSAAVRYMKNGTLPWHGSRQLTGTTSIDEGEMAAEKLAQELLWVTNKLMEFRYLDEALEQWSFASGLASLSLGANPRVQGFIIKIFAILSGELRRESAFIPREVKFGLLTLWLPLCCHGSNGLSYPVMTGLEKVEAERAMNEVISSLPAIDQEVILTRWFQEFTVSSSDWPNLQVSYDLWCQHTRKLA
ncbi:hypothetical protein BT93_D1969 [Corymbia citriodora subsp. variegata]|nr:hypothetical protein BT93_D1969 [Corymbia citriodora subsp. variegata]